MQMELVEDRNAKIKVVGVGGAGGNAVNRMVESGFEGVEFIAINTDIQALEHSRADKKITIGKMTTAGLGAGAKPSKAYEAIQEDREEVKLALEGADMIFITAGMGGGTGTGAAPVVAEICRELGILSVAVVTKPFRFEGPVRKKNSASGISGVIDNVDTIITISNDKVLKIAEKKMSYKEGFAYCDGVLTDAVRGITDIILKHGVIQVDFADVKAIMENGGQALMGTGIASGENRAVEAASKAITSPLLDDLDIAGATGLLVNITASANMGMHEVNEAMEYIYNLVGEDNESNIIFGISESEDIGDSLSVTVIATGFVLEGEEKRAAKAPLPVTPLVQNRKAHEASVQNALQPQNRPSIVDPLEESISHKEFVATSTNCVAHSGENEIAQYEQPATRGSYPSYGQNQTVPQMPVMNDNYARSIEEKRQADLSQSRKHSNEQVFNNPQGASEFLAKQVDGDHRPEKNNITEGYRVSEEEDYEVPAFLRNMNQ